MSAAAILGYVALGVVGVVILCVGAWRLSTHACRRDDIAPGADVARSLPSLYEKRAKG